MFESFSWFELVIPLHKLDQVLRKLSIVHLKHLVDFTEVDEVEVGNLVSGQVSILLQECVYPLQTLFMLIMHALKTHLSFRVARLRSLLRRKQNHCASPEELGCCTADIAIEIFWQGLRLFLLLFVHEDLGCFLSLAHQPLEKQWTSADNLLGPILNHWYRFSGVQLHVCWLGVLLLESVY